LIYSHVISAMVSAAMAALAAWGIQGWRMDAEISSLKTEYATQQARAVEMAHAETIRLQSVKDSAEKLAARRQSDLARDLAANRDALGRLSHAADSALQRASDSHSACIATAASQGVVLNQCSTRLIEVAASADGHASDVQTMTDAWPKKDNHVNNQD